jgi:hypothetical protein
VVPEVELARGGLYDLLYPEKEMELQCSRRRGGGVKNL